MLSDMKYKPGYRSRNVEDRRAAGGGRGGGGGRALRIGGGVSLPVILLVTLFTVCSGGDGGDLGSTLPQMQESQQQDQGQGFDASAPTIDPAQDPENEQVSFISFAFDDIQATWQEIFAASELGYQPTTMVLYRQGTSTAGCGYGQAAYGPFYCPADSKTYVDLGFFDQLASRFGAAGDFAQAYVIAHEVGHHVQNQLGISTQVRQQQQTDPGSANDLSVAMELQADCFAGVWAYSAYEDGLTESGDVEEAIVAAEAIGDDNIQAQAGQPVNPETFTHGSSEQRVQWFTTGYETGDPNQCNTFG